MRHRGGTKLLVAIATCVGLAVSARAADFPVKAMFNPVPVATWTGIYGGVHLGAAWGYFLTDPVLPGPRDVAGDFMFGGQLGYSWQSGRIVYGVEADGSWIRIRSVSPAALFEESSVVTARARVGYTFESFLFYLTGGVGFTQVKTSVTPFGSDSAVKTGVAGGAGLEWRFMPHWSARLEGLFVDVPRQNYNNGTFVTNGGSHNYLIRGGLNYWLMP
jgi:outer membrane immunogenic protein